MSNTTRTFSPRAVRALMSVSAASQNFLPSGGRSGLAGAVPRIDLGAQPWAEVEVQLRRSPASTARSSAQAGQGPFGDPHPASLAWGARCSKRLRVSLGDHRDDVRQGAEQPFWLIASSSP